MANMDETKFGRLTADMLVRKGDAEPSDIRRPRKRKNESPPLNVGVQSPAPIRSPAYQTADQTVRSRRGHRSAAALRRVRAHDRASGAEEAAPDHDRA